MPSLQYIQLPEKQNPLADVLGAFGQGISKGLQKNFDQVREHQLAEKDVKGLRTAIDNSKGDYRSSLINVLRDPNIRPEAKKLYLDNINQMEQYRIQEDKNKLTRQPTEYQLSYLQNLKDNLDQREKDFALKFDSFTEGKKKDQLKQSNDYFDVEIKSLQSILNNRNIVNSPEQFEALKDQIAHLNKRKHTTAQKILGGKPLSLENDYGILGEAEASAGEAGFQQEPGMAPQAQVNMQASQGKPKVKFNSKNPDHVARARQVLAEVNGDQNKANDILAQEFSE